ncbi:hypothetical protein Tco_0299471 [Tanacetum coccineum]
MSLSPSWKLSRQIVHSLEVFSSFSLLKTSNCKEFKASRVGARGRLATAPRSKVEMQALMFLREDHENTPGLSAAGASRIDKYTVTDIAVAMENIAVEYFLDLRNFESRIVIGVDDTQVVVDKPDRVSFALQTEDTVARKNLSFVAMGRRI